LLVLGLGTSTGVGGAAERMDATAAAREKGMTDAVLSALHAGQPQELLVRFSNPADDQAIAALRAKSLLSHDSAEIIELRATRFASVKRAVLSVVSRASETEVVRDYDHLPMMFLRFRSAPAILEFLAKPKVVRVYENRIHHALLAESLPLIGQPSVAASGKTGAGTTVAVLDTGVDYTRAAFGFCTSPGVPAGCRVAYSQDFAPNDGQLDDPGVAYHGTNVAGIVVGVAPGARIAALDVFTGDGARDSDILAAGNWCIAKRYRRRVCK
jgi:subtilisin family serine protease